MIQGFEEQTQPLNDYERDTLLPLITLGLKTKVGQGKAITGSCIVDAMKRAGYTLDAPRLRKIVNHIRNNDLLPGLVSTSKGYFVASTGKEIDECIISLTGCVEAIQGVINALKRQRIYINH